MLVLSRKTNQTIVINGTIEIQILKIKGHTVRLGIQAPEAVKILRGELSPFPPESHRCGIVAGATAGYETDDFDRLPNPFAVSHAS